MAAKARKVNIMCKVVGVANRIPLPINTSLSLLDSLANIHRAELGFRLLIENRLYGGVRHIQTHTVTEASYSQERYPDFIWSRGVDSGKQTSPNRAHYPTHKHTRKLYRSFISLNREI